jgi:hypothetical protein
MFDDHRLSISEHARYVDAAKRRAARLRAQAIGEFWTAVGKALRKGVKTLTPRLHHRKPAAYHHPM